MKPPWLIAAAMEEEVRGLRKALLSNPRETRDGPGPWTGTHNGVPFVLCRTGVGEAAVRRSLEPVLRSGTFRGILSIGSAGALHRALLTGDLLLPAEVLRLSEPEEPPVRTDPLLRARALAALGGWPHGIHLHPMLTADRVVCSAADKIRLGRKHGARSVEMESAVVGTLAAEASLPFLVIRVVLDEAGFSFPDPGRVLAWWEARRFGRLFRFLAMRPLAVTRLLRLFRRSLTVSRRLTNLFRDFPLLESLDEAPGGLTGEGKGGGGPGSLHLDRAFRPQPPDARREGRV